MIFTFFKKTLPILGIFIFSTTAGAKEMKQAPIDTILSKANPILTANFSPGKLI